MMTIPLVLDGYTDLPPGKIANVVTYFEMTAPPTPQPATQRGDFTLRRVVRPDLAWYRNLFRRVGEDWLWFSDLVIPDADLVARLGDTAVETYVLERSDEAVGMAELDRRKAGEVEITFFGVVKEAIGTSAARFLMDETLRLAFTPDLERVWLHTCTFDHPKAVPFYLRSGFTAYKYAIEVSDDPRLTGHLPLTAAPHVPVIMPVRTAEEPAIRRG